MSLSSVLRRSLNWPFQHVAGWVMQWVHHAELRQANTDNVTAPSWSMRWVRMVLWVVCLCTSAWVVTLPMSPGAQWVWALVLVAVSWVLFQTRSRWSSVALGVCTLLVMMRYVWWRLSETLQFNSTTSEVAGTVLLLAESFFWCTTWLSMLQTAFALQRPPAPIAQQPKDYPHVDVFIPSYDEDLSVVMPAVLAAYAMDWPQDKLHIYLLDDGRRPAFKQFADQLGVHYVTRPDNRGAKAGNLNHALAVTQGEFIAIFDADHIPNKLFLQQTMGWLLREPACAMVQTPHHFFSSDPFEKNLGTAGQVPNEGALFYGLVQDGNDLWNATFFCGSCAVLRRSALMDVGGIAEETVTEDAHTALKLHRKGYTTAYINETLAAGLATESLSAHIKQRTRWGRGMAQIFRRDNPLFGRGLSMMQRLCYTNAMLNFFFGLPRLVLLISPLAYLLLGVEVINATPLDIVVYALPFIVQVKLWSIYTQSKYRGVFWSEVYETVLAWYLILPTTMALLLPKVGRFNVTAKGGVIETTFFDWRYATPCLLLISLCGLGFALGVHQLWVSPAWVAWAVVLNLVWLAYNMVILGAAVGVALEQRQVRQTPRVQAYLPANLVLPNQNLQAVCRDFSMTGLRLDVPGQTLPVGTDVQLQMSDNGQVKTFPVRVINASANSVGVVFVGLTMQQRIDWVQCTFARPLAWRRQIQPLQGVSAPRSVWSVSKRGYASLGLQLWRMVRSA